MKYYRFLSKKCQASVFCVFTIILLVLVSTANAETIRGCYVNGVLYTNNTSKGNRFFYRTGGLVEECGYAPEGSNDGICRLYDGGQESKNSSYTIYEDSFNNKWSVVSCPIDDYIWPLLILISIVSIVKFRQQYNNSTI